MFINLTRHEINEVISGKTIKPSGITAVAPISTAQITEHEGIPIFQSTISSKIENLPEPKEGVYYIIPSMLLNVTDRTDVVATGNPVKKDGKVIGCRGFRFK